MKYICISITFNNPLKVYFSSKKYLITIQTRPTQIVISIFLIEKPVFNRFLKIIGVQNQLPITFCSDLVCDINGWRFDPHKHEFVTINILLKPNKKW